MVWVTGRRKARQMLIAESIILGCGVSMFDSALEHSVFMNDTRHIAVLERQCRRFQLIDVSHFSFYSVHSGANCQVSQLSVWPPWTPLMLA